MPMPMPTRLSLAARCLTTTRPPSTAVWLALAALLTLSGSGIAGEEEDARDPYVVFVADEAVFARCGPDGEYYRTDPLRLGQELEVHLETAEGWLGIRPPENSFSWIPASAVQRIEGTETARVIDSETVAWIGTSLGRARKYRWQIQLTEGEEVVIVGQSERQDDQGSQTWYRIVPPSGEFRWVHRSQVVESAEELVARTHDRRSSDEERAKRLAAAKRDEPSAAPPMPEATPTQPAVEATAENRPAEAADDRPARAVEGGALRATLQGLADAFHVDGRPVGSGLAAAPQSRAGGAAVKLRDDVVMRDIDSKSAPPSAPDAADDNRWTNGVRPAAATSVAGTPSYGASATTNSPRIATATDSPAVAAALTPTVPPVLQPIEHDDPAEAQALATRAASADVAQLQLELSRQMAAGASAQMVQPIRQRASDWVRQLTDPTDRGRARLLLERVEQYQRVALRRNGQEDVLPAMGVTSAAPSATPAAAADTSVTADPADAAARTSTDDVPAAFDRRGYLVQVYSARPDSPPYALTDASGRTLAYVSPAPGLNLHRYLNRQVGLYGQLSYHAGLETPHLIAQRAVQTQ